MIESNALIPVGKITSTHGVRGLLRFHSYSGNIESLQARDSVTIRSRDGVLNTLKLESITRQTTKLLIGFQGLHDINQVESLVGSEICLLRSQLPKPEDDEYYWCDLVGMLVETVDGVELGVLKEVFEAGSSDIYVIHGAGKEYLIPAIADVIKKIDLENRLMLVNPLEGMLDL